MEDQKCMACECPCDEHKEHTHDKGNKCMACECPCEEHKEHTHGNEGEHKEEKPSGACSSCNHAHKDDGHCDCGCA